MLSGKLGRQDRRIDPPSIRQIGICIYPPSFQLIVQFDAGQETSSTALSLLCGPGAFSKSLELLTRKPYMTPTLRTSSDSRTTQVDGRDLRAITARPSSKMCGRRSCDHRYGPTEVGRYPEIGPSKCPRPAKESGAVLVLPKPPPEYVHRAISQNARFRFMPAQGSAEAGTNNVPATISAAEPQQ